jgi:hypothetical protein
MDETGFKKNSSTRVRVFVIGTALTLILCGLVLVCVPRKPTAVVNDVSVNSDRSHESKD